MTQTTKGSPTTYIINPNWILLENCLNISSIRNNSLVQNIQPCDAGEELRAYTNDGHQYYDHTETLSMLPFEKKKMNNPLKKLSFDAGASKFRITINAELKSFIIIQLHEGTMIIFKQCGTGLYYIDTTNEAFSENQTIDNTFLNTVDSNKLCFHRR